MATFVLVHGAWAGGWSYAKTARLMRAAGHEVFTPTLTGLGERSHLADPGITLSTHIQDVVNVLRYEDLTEVILVGHSYGGMVVTGVASRVGERLRALVYLDAFVPEDGQSLWDIAGEKAHEFYLSNQAKDPGFVPAMLAARSEDAEVQARRKRNLDRQPLLTLLERLTFTGEETALPRTYIYATKSTFARFYDKVKDDPAWTTKTIDTGHVVMMEDPEGLARLLLEDVET
jgi:pimeloyl-ACP methyl ester carboxylesterase